jgi:hypothetical protein
MSWMKLHLHFIKASRPDPFPEILSAEHGGLHFENHQTKFTTGKTLAAVLANSAVRPRTAKISLPCCEHTMHSSDKRTAKVDKSTRQRK